LFGSARTFSGDMSDAEGDNFAQTVLNTPPIAGTMQDYQSGKNLFNLYCAQCHGTDGQGDGPTSINTPGGYISPAPANFTESGGDFQYYGRYVWKVEQGVETTNMPPWKYVMNDNEAYQLVFYVQTFSSVQDYNTKWAGQYNDSFARNLKGGPATSSFTPNVMITTPVGVTIAFAAVLLWNQRFRQMNILHEKMWKLQISSWLNLWRVKS